MNTELIEDYTKIFSALSHPLRLSIALGLLRKGRCNVNTMSERLNISQSLVSQHVRILKDAGIIKGQRDGTVIWYSISSDEARCLLSCLNLDCDCDNSQER